MADFYVYKVLRQGLTGVARVSLRDHVAQIESSEKQIETVLRAVLSRPARVHDWRGTDLVKREPKDLVEHVIARLKRFLPSPYFASRDVPEGFSPRYSGSVEVIP